MNTIDFEKMFVNGLEVISMGEVRIYSDDHTVRFRMCGCKVCSTRYSVKLGELEESIKVNRKICDLCFEKAKEEYNAFGWVDFSFEEYLNTKVMTVNLGGRDDDESEEKMSFVYEQK